MYAKRMLTVLPGLLKRNQPVFIWGAPGVGKSSIVRQVCDRLGMPVIDLRATLLDPTDLRGIPMLQDGKAVWCPPSFLPTEKDKPGVIFLDELNAAPPLVQASMYQLVLDKRVGEYVLPEGWKIVAAGNRQEDKAVTFRMSSALANRFIHLDLEADASCWQEWAVTAGVHPLVTAFLRMKPTLLWVASDNKENAFASPRSWEMLSEALKCFDKPDEVFDFAPGIVGKGQAIEFIEFARSAMSQEEIDAIIDNPEKAKLPKRLDGMWTLVCWIGANAKEDRVAEAAAVLLGRLTPEFAVVMAKNTLMVRPMFMADPRFIAFMQQHGKFFEGI